MQRGGGRCGGGKSAPPAPRWAAARRRTMESAEERAANRIVDGGKNVALDIRDGGCLDSRDMHDETQLASQHAMGISTIVNCCNLVRHDICDLCAICQASRNIRVQWLTEDTRSMAEGGSTSKDWRVGIKKEPMTSLDGGAKQMDVKQWVGSSSLALTFACGCRHSKPQKVAPVYIDAGSTDEGWKRSPISNAHTDR